MVKRRVATGAGTVKCQVRYSLPRPPIRPPRREDVIAMAKETRDRKRPDPEIPFEEKGTDTVYDPVPKDIDERSPESNLPPEAPDEQTTMEEKTVATYQEHRIAKRQGKK